MASSPSHIARSGWWRRNAGVARGRAVRFEVDVEAISAFEGECLALALAVAGHLTLRYSPEAGGSRGFFCLMGVCQECVVEVDGELRAACMEAVRDGMTVTLGRAKGSDGPPCGVDK